MGRGVERVKKRWWAMGALAVLWVGAALLARGQSAPALGDGLFAWGGETLLPENRGALTDTLARLDADVLYQEFPAGTGAETAAEFLTDMEAAGVEVYCLAGAPEWGLEEDGRSLVEAIDRAAALGPGVRGVMADVEPYLTPAWDRDSDAVMERYVSGMAAAREHARGRGLSLIACIPYWYDNDHADALARLMATGCDGVAVMNYYRGAEAEHLRTELELARRAGIPTVCVSEFQQPGTHDLTDKTTYYTDGLEAARESWAAVREALGDGGLSFAYHWYAPVRELLER